MIPAISRPDSFTFFAPTGVPYTVNSDHENFESVKEAILCDEDVDHAIVLLDTKTFITVYSNGLVEIDDQDNIRINGQTVSDSIVERIRTLHNADEPFDSLANFANLLQDNPNAEVREDLYRWLEAGNMPLTPEGHFIAYKKVQDDYFSYHSGKNGKVYHGVGQRVSMEREECDESRYNTCSTGLHFCSYSYLPAFFGHSGKVLAVSVNPRDVVAIPTDYNLAKGRTCAYTVISELDPANVEFAFSGSPVYRGEEDYQANTYTSEDPDFDWTTENY